MEEIQEKETVLEPEVNPDNSKTEPIAEGQAEAATVAEAPSELILGKFKSVEDLSKAYQELEKHQGIQSAELGLLRQNSAALNNITQAWDKQKQVKNAEKALRETAEKYNTPQYFQDPSFREMYREAFLALGDKLDADRFINLLEGYVSSRIFASERAKAEKAETDKVIDTMSFSKNEKNSLTPPKKRLDEMTQKEVDELLERLI